MDPGSEHRTGSHSLAGSRPVLMAVESRHRTCRMSKYRRNTGPGTCPRGTAAIRMARCALNLVHSSRYQSMATAAGEVAMCRPPYRQTGTPPHSFVSRPCRNTMKAGQQQQETMSHCRDNQPVTVVSVCPPGQR